MHKLWAIAILGTLAAGCSSGDSGQEPAAAADSKAAAPQPPAETVFDPMVGTIDRAKSVNSLSTGRMDELNQQLEESE